MPPPCQVVVGRYRQRWLPGRGVGTFHVHQTLRTLERKPGQHGALQDTERATREADAQGQGNRRDSGYQRSRAESAEREP